MPITNVTNLLINNDWKNTHIFRLWIKIFVRVYNSVCVYSSILFVVDASRIETLKESDATFVEIYAERNIFSFQLCLYFAIDVSLDPSRLDECEMRMRNMPE